MTQPSYEAVSPATGETIETYGGHTDDDVDAVLEAADDEFDAWSARRVEERQSLLADAAEILRDRKHRYAELMAREMGKPVTAAESEVEKCAWVCDYYSDRAAEHLQDERIGAEPHAETYVRYEPLGVVLAVMPWNYLFHYARQTNFM